VTYLLSTTPIPVRSGTSLSHRLHRLEALDAQQSSCPPLVIWYCRDKDRHTRPSDDDRTARCAGASTLLRACVAFCHVCFPEGDQHAA
jgi:hypothetical protein